MSLARSWGGYPNHPHQLHPCHWRDDIQRQLDAIRTRRMQSLPFGNGRSYGDSCLADSGQALHLRPLTRFIGADWEQGLVTLEAGVTLDELLRLSIPRGWFLPVTPGTQFVTIGGAIANDVHGKNHHVRGTFGRHVEQIALVRSDKGRLSCSLSQNGDIYRATIGGLGLTGIIESARIGLRRIGSSQVRVRQIRFGNLAEFFALSRELDERHEYSVAWVDCLSSGRQAGRGLYMVGDHDELPPCKAGDRYQLRAPFTPPVPLFNALTLKLFNNLYYHLQGSRPEHRLQDYQSFFYPLDGLLEWNRIYGPYGLQQYQCVVPDDCAKDAIGALLAAISRSNEGSFLAVLKRCGDIQSPGLLSFPLPGVSLALDFPQRGQTTARLFERLDAILREAGGRLYPAKDAHMSGKDFRTAYPAWVALEALRDPLLLSRFWQRVTQP